MPFLLTGPEQVSGTEMNGWRYSPNCCRNAASTMPLLASFILYNSGTPIQGAIFIGNYCQPKDLVVTGLKRNNILS